MGTIVLIHTRARQLSTSEHLKHTPVQLLGMKGILEKSGHRVTVVDAIGQSYSAEQVIRRTLETNPDIVGINAFFDSNLASIRFDAKVLDGIKAQQPHVVTILGGAITFRPQMLQEGILGLKPDIVVRGQGELPIDLLSRSAFDGTALTGSNEVTIEHESGTPVLTARKAYNLDLTGFERPPEWYKYELTDLDWQRGCVGSCGFCAGLDGALSYKSPINAAMELDYLYRMGSRNFFTLGPDFTGNASKATRIIEEINRVGIQGTIFISEVRLDTFSRALGIDGSAWRQFGIANRFDPIIGYESGVPLRLQRMGKVSSIAQSEKYLPGLINILDANYPFNIWLAWMLIQPESTSAQVLFDILTVRGMLTKYFERLRLNPASLMNNMVLAPGMELFETTPINWHRNLDGPLRSLLDTMNDLNEVMNSAASARNKLVSMLGNTLGKLFSRSRDASFGDKNSGAERFERKKTIFVLGLFAQQLLEHMEADQVRDAYSIAYSFKDARVKDLFEWQMKESRKNPILSLFSTPTR